MKQGEKEFLQALGANIDKLRIKKGLSMQELANLIEIDDRSNLNRILKGRTNPSALLLHKLSIALNCSVKDFFKS